MHSKGDSQDVVNARVYHAVGVVREYVSQSLNRCETVTLLKYQAAFAGRDVLDLGVGTGRTAIYLAPLARRYQAIDYSPAMVDRAHARLPDVEVHLLDMRDLSMFADASFDTVFGTNNVFDTLSHADRAQALTEAHRVLRVGGMLLFTSHNRAYRDAGRKPRFAWSRNPVVQAARAMRWVRCLANDRRVRPLCRADAEFALFNDDGHDFACLHYYIDQATQRRRLATEGFRVVDVLDMLGSSVLEDDPVSNSSWLMYVAEHVARPSNPVPTDDSQSI